MDRYGQPSPRCASLTYYGIDNQIDGIVLDVLLRKHKAIRNSLGISVPVPVDTDAVDRGGLRGAAAARGREATAEQLHALRATSSSRSRRRAPRASGTARGRAREAVAHDVRPGDDQARRGRPRAGRGPRRDRLRRRMSRRFTRTRCRAYGGGRHRRRRRSGPSTSPKTPRALRELLGDCPTAFTARFELPVAEGELYLTRTHPVVEGLAATSWTRPSIRSWSGVARRCGVIRTSAVTRRTTLLLMRLRFHIVTELRRAGAPPAGRGLPGCSPSPGRPQTPSGSRRSRPRRCSTAEPDGQRRARPGAPTSSDWSVDGFDRARARIWSESPASARASCSTPTAGSAGRRAHGRQLPSSRSCPPDVLGIYVYLPQAARSP